MGNGVTFSGIVTIIQRAGIFLVVAFWVLFFGMNNVRRWLATV